MRIHLIRFVLILCVLYVIIHQFLLQIPAKGDWQYNLGMLFQAMSLSYIAAFLFYLVHNYYPELRTKKKYQPVINRELSDLWEICNGLTYTMRHHSGVPVNDFETNKLKVAVAKQLQELPVNLNKVEDEENIEFNGQNIYPIIPDDEFDKKNKPIVIREMSFSKWSEAIEYVNSNISNTLNKILKLKDVIDEETILTLFDLEKSINDFRMVAKIYEESNTETFGNGYLEVHFVKFHKGTQELKKYKK